MRHLPVHPSLVHPRTGEAIMALGFRKDGRPIWPIIGGDGTEDDKNDDDTDNAGDDDGDGPDDDKLAPEDDPESIEYWRKRSRQNEREAKKAKRERDAALKTPPKADKADDDKPDIDKIRAEARAEAAAEQLRGRVEDKIEAKAHAFADPEDAVAVLLRNSDIEDFIDDGKVDADAIAEALKELGEKKPHLLAKGGKKFQGDGDGGPRKEAKSRPKDLGDAVARHYQKN